MLSGLFPLPWWGYVATALVLTHVTIASVTIFLHRHQAHRALELDPVASHFFRFWLWLTTGMITREWTAVHRKHHAKCETTDDPHSPVTRGIEKVLWEGAELYRSESRDPATVAKYGVGTPDDWLERRVYSRHNTLGIALMLIMDVLAFGPIGLTIWAVQMVWIPLFAAGVVNGIGHYWGYRNFSSEDKSHNIVPWGILIGGEELHNNHHAHATSARLSSKWYEFDIGWLYIRTLETFGLAKVKRTAPRLLLDRSKQHCDKATLQAVLIHRYEVMARFARALRPFHQAELRRLKHEAPQLAQVAHKARNWLRNEPGTLEEQDKACLAALLDHSAPLATIYNMRLELIRLWARTNSPQEQLLAQLQNWCSRAEASGIEALQRFSIHLRHYTV